MELQPGCISCKILSGEIQTPGVVIYENSCWHVDFIRPPVVWPGFLIVKLKRHCEDIAGLTPEEAQSLGPTLQVCSQALSAVLKPAKIYVCSFGDGVRHIHFWLLPRPVHMRAGMHWVMLNLDVRTTLTRLLKVQNWVIPPNELERTATELRAEIARDN